MVASALELVLIAEVRPLLAAGDAALPPFTPREWAYARSKRDTDKRLAARLAAKRAAARLLGIPEQDVEVERGRFGPPRVLLSDRGEERLRALGATRVLVSLTHGETHAAASVLLTRDD